ncbi:MAG: heavy metal translocating P-type ATPase [Prochlorococcaceae cyanobacterium]
MTSDPLLLEIDGLRCGGCVAAVERRLRAQAGVGDVSVNLLTHTAWVALQEPPPAVEGLLESLADLGFPARLRPDERPVAPAPTARWRSWRPLLVALLLLLVSSVGHLAMAGPLADMRLHGVVATLALAGPGRPILRRGWQGLRRGHPGMDSLVGLGLASAWSASLVALLWPAVGWSCFFNEPVMLLGFVLLGRFLEERARHRSGRALERLARLQPDQALLVLGEGPPRPVLVGALRPGDRLRLLPGDRVPVDGRVMQGTSSVDVSALTGEPLPLTASPGTELAAGSLNLQAPLDLEVLRDGAGSAVARIIALVERAQARRAPIQALADRWAGRFTWIVLALALATVLFWWLWGTQLFPEVLHGLAHGHGHHRSLGAGADTPLALALQLGIAVLVVACPCALGLATPTAVMVASGRAAERGLLFRGGDAIEMAARVRHVLFDKTGTLTVGRPRLVDRLVLAPDLSADELLSRAAALERHSRHPLGWALLQAAEELSLTLPACSGDRSLPGDGVTGVVEGVAGELRLGRPGWVGAGGPVADAWLARQERQGATVVALACCDALLGLLAISDAPRADARSALVQLRELGLGLGVLSGDREGPVVRLGEALGIPAAALAWELRPADKVAAVEAGPRPLAMVGDGINDAPALAAADLGIAVGTGTQIAQDTADLVVLGERLEAVPEALRLARGCLACVRANLAWAFGYNLVVLPLAAGVLLPRFGVLLTPPLAALLMAMSSITVVLNALLQRPVAR